MNVKVVTWAEVSTQTPSCWFLSGTLTLEWPSISYPCFWSTAKPSFLECWWSVWRSLCRLRRHGFYESQPRSVARHAYILGYHRYQVPCLDPWLAAAAAATAALWLMCQAKKRQNDFGHDQYLIADLFEALNTQTRSYRKAYCRLGITLESWQMKSLNKFGQ